MIIVGMKLSHRTLNYIGFSKDIIKLKSRVMDFIKFVNLSGAMHNTKFNDKSQE